MLTLRLRSPTSPRAGRGRRIWLFPVVLALVMRLVLALGLLNLVQLIAIAAGIPALLALSRRPALAIRLLVIVLPFQLLITSGLYELGLQGGLVRMLSLWKEMAAAAVVVAACRSAIRSPRRLDALDRAGLSFVALGTLYLVIPELFVAELGASLSMDVRFIGWRTLVLPLLLLVAARHVRLSSGELAGIVRTAVGVGLALGGIGLFEFVSSDLWNTLLVDTLGVNRFRVEVLEVNPASLGFNLDDIRIYGEVAGREFTRIGGPMVSYLQMSFALLVAGGLLFERLVRGARSKLTSVGVVLLGLGVVVTQTRSAIVGGALLVVTVLRPAPGREEHSRVRYTLLVAAAMVVVVPLFFGSGLSDRFTGGDSGSDDAHEESFDRGFDIVTSTPFGRGLATGTAVGSAEVAGSVTSENHFLDLGIQLGWLGILLFVAVLGLLLRTLRRAALGSRDPTIQTGLLGIRTSFIALLVPCWYLQPFTTPEVAWVAFALAGAALGAASHEQRSSRSSLAEVAAR